MSRRIDVELTSDRGDGTLTWRAAGAKAPKGVLSASLLPSGVKVGDTVKVDADYDMEGVTIVAVLPPTAKKQAENVIEFIGAPPPPPRDYSKEPERRERSPGQKMVVLSNYATPDIRMRCAQLGVDAVFDKSNEIDALVDYCVAHSRG